MCGPSRTKDLSLTPYSGGGAGRLGGYNDVSELKVSLTGRFVVLTVDRVGDERYDAHVIDLESNSPEPVEVLKDVWSVEWAGPSNRLLYTRTDDRRRPALLFEHRPLTPQQSDRVVFEESDHEFFLDVSRTKDDQFVTINSNSKECSEVRVVPSDGVVPAAVLLHPRPGQGTATGFQYYVEHAENYFYIVTNDGAPDFKVVRAPDRSPTRRHWRDFVWPAPGSRIEDAEFFRRGCVLQQRNSNGLLELGYVPFSSDETAGADAAESGTRLAVPPSATATVRQRVPASIELPAEHRIGRLALHSNTDFDASVVHFSSSSPLIPHVDWQFHMATGDVNVAHRAKVVGDPPFSPAEHAVSKLQFPAPGGVEVPVTLIGPEDGASRPLLACVYGAYGECLEPEFRPEHLPLLQRGWRVALCHVRGGGECGPQWHRGGQREKKAFSAADLAACIEGLVGMGLVEPGLVAVRGVSAGAVAAAALLNARPKLVGAALLEVPFVDVLGAMLDSTLPLTIHERPEWGDPIANPAAFEAIQNYCPYTNLARQTYPPVLVTTCPLDDRVPSWQPLKYVARLRDRATTPADGPSCPERRWPILLPSTGGGHFGNAGLGAKYAFLFMAMGLPLE